MIKVVERRACDRTELQREYMLLLLNADCKFIQLEYWKDGLVGWIHLKGCADGTMPQDLKAFIEYKLGKITKENKWWVRCLHYHYGDKRFRELTITYPR